MICGLVLAAGAGVRYGEKPKLLAALDGRPLLEHALRAQAAVGELERVVVVLGANAAAVLDAVDLGRVEAIVCPEWREGQAASLRCGVRALTDAQKLIVTLGDEPLISSAVIARFLSEPARTRATYDGRPGHPVVLGRSEMAAIMRLSGDRGARGLLRGARTIECAQLCSGRDVDTPEDLAAVQSESRASRARAAHASPPPDGPRSAAAG